MENKEAVEEKVEETTPVESAPTEENTVDPQPAEEVEAPVESTQPANKVSDSVPYDRFQEVNSKAKSLEEENAYLKSQQQAPAATSEAVPELDPDAERGVRSVARQEWDEMERRKFVQKHKSELDSNLPLAGTVRELIARENAAGRLADRDSIMTQAKKILKETPVVKEAQTAGFEEGQKKAVLKNQTGAVGSTNFKEPEVDDSALSTEEFRKKYNVPRI